ncbi:hypothetical protein BJF85_23705 [Saccharomonospora sp. CUA-673]|uniref:hypothetical protein n=1 Tax=Saccharomonospora sp. CUA-673 TaxID=1904969 RepID=UPI000959E7FE|nr:hypothetical protein BJF85_23705 [Saccharomonospora sp. CUA-673]
MTGRRVAVTSPQTRLAHARKRYRAPWRPATLDPAEVPRAIALYRGGRRRAVTALAALGVLILGLPLALALLPVLDEVRMAGVPVSWLAIVLIPFPAMVALAFWHLRRAERIEDQLYADTAPHAGTDGSDGVGGADGSPDTGTSSGDPAAGGGRP